MSEQHDETEAVVDEAVEPAGDDELEPGDGEHGDDGEQPNGDDDLEARLAAELGDDVDEPGAGDDELQPPTGQQPSEKEIEQTYKRLDAETARHVKRVAELVGEDAFRHLVVCELCDPSMPGFRWPRPPADEVKAAVRMAIGDRQPENWQADTYSRRCDSCQGLGEVLTGSQVRGQETLGCLECGSRGWIPIGPERGRPNVVHLATPAPAHVDELPVPAAADDPPEVAALKAAGYVVIKPAAAE